MKVNTKKFNSWSEYKENILTNAKEIAFCDECKEEHKAIVNDAYLKFFAQVNYYYLIVVFTLLSILKFIFIDIPFTIPYRVFGSVLTMFRQEKKLRWYEVFIATFMVTAFDLITFLFVVGFLAGFYNIYGSNL